MYNRNAQNHPSRASTFFAPTAEVQNSILPAIDPSQSRYQTLKSTALSAAQQNRYHVVDELVRDLIRLDVQQVLQDIEAEEDETHRALYYATVFYHLGRVYHGSERALDWLNRAAFLYGIIAHSGRLGDVAQMLISKDRVAAIENLQHPHFQSNPLYCARVYEELAVTALPHENIAEWYRWGAYYYILAKSYDRPTRLLENFIRHNRELASQDANNPHLQQTAPMYCARIFNLLAKIDYQSGQSESALNHYRQAAFYYALAKEENGLNYCANKVMENRSGAIEEANAHSHDNPLYSAKLFNLLYVSSSSLQEQVEYLRGEAYCLAFTDQYDYFRRQVGRFVQRDTDRAYLDSSSEEIHQANPIYAETLNEILVQLARTCIGGF